MMLEIFKKKENDFRDFLGGTVCWHRWLGIHLPVQGTQIQSLVWKDSTHSETTKAHTKQRIPSTAKNE